MSTALQLPVEFIEHEVAEQRRKWTPLRSPVHAWTDQPVLHHPGVQERPNELSQPLVLDTFCDLPHQFVVIDSIEELLQVEIDHPTVTLREVLLRLGYCDARIAPVENRSCDRRTSSPTAVAEPASPLAEEIDRA